MISKSHIVGRVEIVENQSLKVTYFKEDEIRKVWSHYLLLDQLSQRVCKMI
jgi:hypothetical protein